MLPFLRKHQYGILLVVAVVVIIAFTFWGDFTSRGRAEARMREGKSLKVLDTTFPPEEVDEIKRTFQALINLGLTDAFRACHDEPHRYTFWDYQAGAFQKNQGLRIDHMLLSPQAADRLQACEIDAAPRSWEKPSDHVPIYIELAL